MSDVDPNSKSKLSSGPGAPAAAGGPQWHIHVPPETYGPYSVQQLRDYAREGRLTADTLVWTEGNAAWGKAADQPSLKSFFAAAAPPPPLGPQPSPPRPAAPSRATNLDDDAASTPFEDAIAPRPAPSSIGGTAGDVAVASGGAMTFKEAVQTCLKLKYAGFQGRARRSEYWWFALFVFLVIAAIEAVAFAVILSTSQNGSMSTLGILTTVLAGLVGLALLVPAIAVAVRRLHDLGWSGWWYLAQVVPIVGGLIALAMLVGFMMRGTVGPNKYGPDPLAGDL